MARLTAEGLRAARAILGLSTRAAGDALGVAFRTIHAIEQGRTFREGTERQIIEGFDRLGVEILNGDAPGARLRPDR